MIFLWNQQKSQTCAKPCPLTLTVCSVSLLFRTVAIRTTVVPIRILIRTTTVMRIAIIDKNIQFRRRKWKTLFSVIIFKKKFNSPAPSTPAPSTPAHRPLYCSPPPVYPPNLGTARQWLLNPTLKKSVIHKNESRKVEGKLFFILHPIYRERKCNSFSKSK